MIKLEFCLPFMDYRFTSRDQPAQLPALKQSGCHYSHFPAVSQVMCIRISRTQNAWTLFIRYIYLTRN